MFYPQVRRALLNTWPLPPSTLCRLTPHRATSHPDIIFSPLALLTRRRRSPSFVVQWWLEAVGYFDAPDTTPGGLLYQPRDSAARGRHGARYATLTK